MSNLSEATLSTWSVDEMAIWLREENLHECVRPFLLKKINGLSFLNLSEYDLKTFQISAESRRKLARILKRMKARKRSHVRSSESGSLERREPKSPSAIPTHVLQQEEGEYDGWGSDFDSADEFEDVEGDESDSDVGEYIEPEEDESKQSSQKDIPKSNIPTGLVAQLRAGLNGTLGKNFLGSHSSANTPCQPEPTTEEEEIYDVPPDEELEELYEQPSDDSGSGVVVRPMDKQKVIRCPSSAPGEYIDARAPKYCEKEDTGPCPPPPSRPPKSGPKLIKPPAKKPSKPPPEPELYEEVTAEDQPGCSRVVEENTGGLEVYEPWDDGPTNQQDMYEMPDENHEGDTYEVPGEEEAETYEIPDELESASPGRPPPRGSGWNPPKKAPEQAKPPLSKKPLEQKPAKPMPGSKPQFSPKPSVPNPPLEKRSSRLYPNANKTGPTVSGTSIKRLSAMLQLPSSKQQVFPPAAPLKKEENNNEKRVFNEISNKSPSPILPPQRKQTSSSLDDDSPPLPPRPGSKPPLKSTRLSDSDTKDAPVGTTSPISKTPLPPLPPQPKSPNDRLKNFPWFHGPLDKKVAEEALISCGKQGAFIVRNSSKDPNNYSMDLFFLGKVKHLRIPRIHNKFVLGDSGKVEFNTIEELVAHYSQHHVDLRSGGSTTLTLACPVK